MHNVYSASHERETHAGWQCADLRTVNNRDNALYTHKTRTIQAQKRTIILQGVKYSIVYELWKEIFFKAVNLNCPFCPRLMENIIKHIIYYWSSSDKSQRQITCRLPTRHKF